jgi:hypothetical protein
MPVSQTSTIEQRMDHFPAKSPGQNAGAQERALRRKAFLITAVGALMMVLAVLDDWLAV